MISQVESKFHSRSSQINVHLGAISTTVGETQAYGRLGTGSMRLIRKVFAEICRKFSQSRTKAGNERERGGGSECTGTHKNTVAAKKWLPPVECTWPANSALSSVWGHISAATGLQTIISGKASETYTTLSGQWQASDMNLKRSMVSILTKSTLWPGNLEAISWCVCVCVCVSVCVCARACVYRGVVI